MFSNKYFGIEIAMLSSHFSILSLVVLKYLKSSFNLSFDSTYGESLLMFPWETTVTGISIKSTFFFILIHNRGLCISAIHLRKMFLQNHSKLLLASSWTVEGWLLMSHDEICLYQCSGLSFLLLNSKVLTFLRAEIPGPFWWSCCDPCNVI